MTAHSPDPGAIGPPSTPLRVLIVEDELAHAELMVRELRRAGFAPEWTRVETEPAYLDHLMPPPELILADYSLPQFGASRALELLQDRGLDIAFIVVSGTMGEEVAVELMRRGATDYLLKDRLARLGQAVTRALDQQRLRRGKQQADDDLRVSEARYRSLFEGVPVGLYRSTPAGKLLDANPAFLRMLGYPDRESLMSEDAVSLYVDPAVRKRWVALLESKGVVTDFESQLRRYEGELIWVRANARLVRDAAGQTLYVEGAIVDITERKRVEETLHRSEASFRLTFASNPLAMWVYDLASLEFLEVNEAAVKQYGYSREEFLAMRITNIRPAEDVPRLLNAVAKQRPALQSSDEWRHRRKNGQIIDVRVVSHTLEFAGRKAAMVVAQDITEQRRAEAETRRRVAELEVFYEVGRRLREAQDVEDIYPILVQTAMRILKAEHGTLVFLDADRRVFTRLYTTGVMEEVSGSTFPVDGSPSGRVVETGTAFVTADFFSGPLPPWLQTPHYRRLGPMVIVPVRSEQGVVGTLGLARTKEPASAPFTDAEVQLLEGIAEIGGTAIRRAHLHRDLEQSYIAMVLALARAADARDSYTADHSERIAARAVALAQALGCGESEVQNIHWGGLLHDIGKLGVPDSILRKPGALTEAEWHVMRQHPIIGEEILRPVERMREVAALVRHHQERWDGTGYPDQLRGEEIPLGARILAVADTYGAMTDDRVYGKGREMDDALAEVRRCAGTQFDPRVVEAFCRMLKEGQVQAQVSSGEAPPSGSPKIQPSGAAIARSLAQARRVGRIVPAMADVAKRLLRSLDLTSVLDEILNQIQEVFGYPTCAVFFIDEHTRDLHVKAQRGWDPAVAQAIRLRVGEQGIAGWVASHGLPYYAPDVGRDPFYVAGAPGARSNVAYPLVVNDRVIGVLDVESPLVDAFPKDVREILEAFAVLAALAILRAQRDEDLNRLALTDGLTGLANHRALWDALEREVARAGRSGHPVSVAIVEVDGFKQINDHLGHLQGDLILRAVADVLRKTGRASDLAARFGGDEFVLLLPEATKQAAAQIAERVRRNVEEILIPAGIRLTVSVGLAGMPEDGDDAKALLETADIAMYAAKHDGGNRVNVA